jgi:hypothetical protein
MSILVAFIAYLLRKAFREAWATQAVKSALEAEIQEHDRTAGELEYAVPRLQLASRAGGIDVWELSTNNMTWMECIFSETNAGLIEEAFIKTGGNFPCHQDGMYLIVSQLKAVSKPANSYYLLKGQFSAVIH